MGAVFFAAIVFAGFLAALRAAGFVPAAFFFAAFDTAFADRLALVATLPVLPPAVLGTVRTGFTNLLVAFLVPVRFDTTFADLRADRLAAFLAEDFDFAAM